MRDFNHNLNWEGSYFINHKSILKKSSKICEKKK